LPEATTVTEVIRLEPGDRAAELSRMLSGDLGSAAALAHAAELLAVAGHGEVSAEPDR
jgi:DNA repair ATPase RecN